jgi:hypothetical protein
MECLLKQGCRAGQVRARLGIQCGQTVEKSGAFGSEKPSSFDARPFAAMFGR